MFCKRCGNRPASALNYFSGFRIGVFKCRFCEIYLLPRRIHIIIYISLLAIYFLFWLVLSNLLSSQLISLIAYKWILVSIIAFILIIDVVIYFIGLYDVSKEAPDFVFDNKDRCIVTIASAFVAFLIAMIYTFLSPISYSTAGIFEVFTLYLVSMSLKYKNWLRLNIYLRELISFLLLYGFIFLVIISLVKKEVSHFESMPNDRQSYRLLESIGD